MTDPIKIPKNDETMTRPRVEEGPATTLRILRNTETTKTSEVTVVSILDKTKYVAIADPIETNMRIRINL